MFFREATERDILHVSVNMRERDYEEISALRYSNSRGELVEALSSSLKGFPTVYCVGDESGPVVIVAYIPTRPGVWNLGMFATDAIKNVGLFLTKTIIRDIIPALDRANAHRVEAFSIDGYTEVHNWLRFLGLKEECTLSKYGKNGEDFKVFSYVRASNSSVKWRKSGEVS